MGFLLLALLPVVSCSVVFIAMMSAEARRERLATRELRERRRQRELREREALPTARAAYAATLTRRRRSRRVTL